MMPQETKGVKKGAEPLTPTTPLATISTKNLYCYPPTCGSQGIKAKFICMKFRKKCPSIWVFQELVWASKLLILNVSQKCLCHCNFVFFTCFNPKFSQIKWEGIDNNLSSQILGHFGFLGRLASRVMMPIWACQQWF